MEKLQVKNDLFVLYDDSTHTYKRESGDVLISTTQLMKKHSLSPSYEGVSKEVLTYKAEVGTIEHSAFETFIKSEGKQVMPSKALFWFRDNLYPKYDRWESEVPVITEGLPTDFAGRIDMIAYKGDEVTIIDIKKTAQIHREALSWQLSLYRYAWCRLHGIATESVLLKSLNVNDEPKLIDVEPIPDSEILRLLESEAKKIPFVKASVVTAKQAKALIAFQKKISALKARQKEAEQSFELAKAEILRGMSAYGLTEFSVGNLSITRVPSYERKTLDKDKVQKDFPETKNDKYFKTSTVAESLRITEKKS